MIFLESRRLLKIKVYVQGPNQYYFKVVSPDGYRDLTLRISFEALIVFLRRIKAKDTTSTPASYRKFPYKVIAQNIVDQTDNEIWVWDNQWKIDTRRFKTSL